MGIMGITKLRYLVDTLSFTKEKGLDVGPIIGKNWNQRAPDITITPTDPHFVRTGDDNLVVIDLDYSDTTRCLDILHSHGFPFDACYIISTRRGGLHYYCRVKQCGRPVTDPYVIDKGISHFFTNVNRGTIDLRGDSPGFVFGPNTKFTNGEYRVHLGSEDTIPWVEGWRVAWLVESGIKTRKRVAGVNIWDFIAGLVDLKDENVLKDPSKGWLVWANVMLALREIGYTRDEIEEGEKHCIGFSPEQCKHDIESYWAHPERIRIQATNDRRESRALAKKEAFEQAVAANGDTKLIFLHAPYTYKFYPEKLVREDPANERIADIASWKQFSITEIVRHVETRKYHVKTNIIDIIAPVNECVIDLARHHQLDSCFKTVMGTLINDWCEVMHVPTKDIPEYMGFRNGWHFPGYREDEIFVLTQMQRDLIKGNILDIKVDKDTAIAAFRDFRNAITMEHRDIVLAWAAQAPFGHDLIKVDKLNFHLNFRGVGGLGKTMLAEGVTSKWWIYPGCTFTPGNVESMSRFAETTASNLPVVLDEVKDLPEREMKKIVGILKSMSTTEVRDWKKGAGIGGQDLSARGMYAGEVITCHNEDNPLFAYDSALEERFLDLYFTKRGKNAEEVTAVFNRIPDGLFGRWFIEVMGTWDTADVLGVYEDIPHLENAKKVRDDTIYRRLHLGKWIVKHVFDADLDLSELNEILSLRDANSTDELASIDEYIDEQRRYDATKQAEELKDRYQRPKWMDNPLEFRDNLVIFSTLNRNDLAKAFQKRKVSGAHLVETLQRKYNSACQKTVHYPGGNKKFNVVLDLGAGFKKDFLKGMDMKPEKQNPETIEFDEHNDDGAGDPPASNEAGVLYPIEKAIGEIPGWREKTTTELVQVLIGLHNQGVLTSSEQYYNVAINDMKNHYKVK